VTEILTGELARGLADLNSPALARTMQSIYHNPPAIEPSALEKFSVDTICQQYRQLRQADAVFNQDRMIYESNAFTEHCGCRL
jgi:hypothetical protein